MILLLLACAERSAEPSPAAAPAEQKSAMDEEMREALSTLGYAEEGAGGGLGVRGIGRGGGGYGSGAAPGAPPTDAAPMGLLAKKRERKDDSDGSVLGALNESAPPARAWFPESFFWQPLVEVPESGSVTVPIPVPDTLTTWRLLALGQSRGGAQGGAVTTFASTLPAYVDLVTPSFLWAGDVVQLPVQAVSQQGDALSAPLAVLAGGTPVGGGAVSLPAYGSRRETVTVRADRAGDLALVARLGELDAVEKTVRVRPVGRPVDQTRGGTLASTRTFTLSGAATATAGELVVTVFPGALGVARAELEIAPLRGDDLAAAAYTYAVARLATPLVAEGTVRADELRATELRAWQRIAKATRAPGVRDASLALLAVRGAPPDTLAGRLAERLVEQLEGAQATDGLWTGASGTTLDDVLVEAARVVWALGPDNEANRLRATGAFERQRARLSSPYVAAWALTAGVVDPTSTDALRTTVREALRTGADGAKTLRVDARRTDGTPVSEAEATALAILALPGDDPARPDLAAGLLGLYDPARGFGDGFTGLVALRALEAVFAGEIPREVSVAVSVDGAEVGRAVLDAKQPHSPVRILAPGLTGAGDRTVTVTATPAVPGLAFTAVARAYVPWVQTPPAGVEVSVGRPTLVVGQRAELAVALAGPAGRAFDVSIGLPAGVEPDGAALDALVASGAATSWRGEDGRVTLRNVVAEGGAWRGVVPVTPTLAGTLLADAATVRVAGTDEPVFVRVPERWTIR